MLRARSSRGGMSLLEVVVALAVMLVMAAIAAEAVFNSIKMNEILAERDETTRAARVTMSRLRREIQLAFIVQGGVQTPNYITQFVAIDNSPDILFFNTFSHQRLYRDARESDQTEITLWTEPARREQGRGYVLYHREAPRIDEEPDEGGVIYPIAYNVRSFNLRFLNSVTNEWVDEWDTRKADYSNRLPRMVQIGLVLIGTDPLDEDRTIDIPFLTTTVIERAPKVQRKAGT